MLTTLGNRVLNSEVGLACEGRDRYEFFVREHAGPMLAIARRYLRREEDAWDAVKDAFRRAEYDPTLVLQAAPTGALRALVLDSAISLLRAEGDDTESAIEEHLPRFLENGQFADTPIRWRSDQSAHVNPAQQHYIRSCVDKLPDSFRIVLVLHDLDGRALVPIATMLGLAVPEARARLHQARQALRALLDPTMRA